MRGRTLRSCAPAFAALGGLLLVPASSRREVAALAAVVPGGADARVDAASAAMDDGLYPKAIAILRSVLAGNSRDTAAGREASTLLIQALRSDGDYRSALAENEALIAVLDRPGQAQPDADLRRDLALSERTLTWLAGKDDALADRAAQAHGPLQGVARADLLLFRNKRDEAFTRYMASVDQALGSRDWDQRDADPVARGMVHAWLLRSEDPAVKAAIARALRIARDGAAAPAQRLLGLEIAHRLEEPTSAWPLEHAVAEQTKSQANLKVLRDEAVRLAGGDAQLGALSILRAANLALDARRFDAASAALAQAAPIERAFPGAAGALGSQLRQIRDLRAWLPLAQGADDALRLEIAGEYAQAAGAYKRLADACAQADAPAHRDAAAQLRAEAVRSARLMTQESEPSAQGGSSCRFLGLDQTIGSDWASSVGAEAWVLFALHGKDLAGGPRVLDGSFTYKAANADPKNSVRRWRDPADYGRRPSDIPLRDPAAGSPGDAIAFLDDNGEDYPHAAGPDLALTVTVPAGDHVLSIPLHFSNPSQAEAHYGFLLLSGDRRGEPRCVAATVVAVPASPGYLKALVPGPGRYTLVVRRQDSLNANIQALFLDPAPGAANPPLSDEFRADELASAGIDGAGGKAGDDGTPSGRLQGLVDAYVQGHGDPAALAQSAEKLCAGGSLTPPQRVVSSYLAWRFFDQSPLLSGKRLAAFSRYVGLRYAGADGPDGEPLRSQMAKQAEWLRQAGEYGYAEVVDDALWDASVRRAQDAGQLPAGQPGLQAQVYEDLWKQGPARYLATRPALLTTGEDDPAPQKATLGLDPLYAAAKARRVSRALLGGDAKLAVSTVAVDKPMVAVSAVAVDKPVVAVSPDAAQVALGWVDTLGSELGVSPNGLKEQLSRRAAGPSIVQPAGAMVYAAACEPLLGGGSSGSPGDAKSCLLRADQLEALARCYLGREMFPADTGPSDAGFAARLLDLIETAHPDYSRLARLRPLRDSLSPAH